MKLKELRERKVIDEIWNIYGEKMEYDDCAIIDDGNSYLLLTTDFIGEGTHFIPSSSAELVGKFFVDVNLSDIAAMGGVPEHFMAAMQFPSYLDFEYVEHVIRGMKHELGKFGVKYLGGDLKESKIIGFSGFAIGHVEKEKILRRRGAKIGDRIFITAPLGEKFAIHFLWKKGLAEFDEILKIEPRIEEGRKIAEIASSGMDISDGLIFSLMELQRAGNVGMSVSIEKVPLHPLAEEVMEDYSVAVERILSFGGDYELIYTAPKKVVGYEIGEVIEERVKYGGTPYESFGKALD